MRKEKSSLSYRGYTGFLLFVVLNIVVIAAVPACYAYKETRACKPFQIPNWSEHDQIEFYCENPTQDPTKEIRIVIDGQSGETVGVTIHNAYSESDGFRLVVLSGQERIVANPLERNCTLFIRNTGIEPEVDQRCK